MKYFFSKALTLALILTPFTLNADNDADSIGSADFERKILQVIENNPEAILKSIIKYQQTQKQQQANLKQKQIKVLLADTKKSIGQSPTTGDPSGKIVMYEFSDFQCPYCSKAHGTVQKFIDKYKDEVVLVYKHLPLPMHSQAKNAARASWAAQQQGKFWEYHDQLFAQYRKISEPFMIKIAKNLKLNMSKFNRDRKSTESNQAVEQDMQLAELIGARGTPYFVLGSEVINGAAALSSFERALKRNK